MIVSTQEISRVMLLDRCRSGDDFARPTVRVVPASARMRRT